MNVIQNPKSKIQNFYAGFDSRVRDIVALRPLGELRKQRQVPLQTLRRFGRWLHQHQNEPWATMLFVTAGKGVRVYDAQGRLVSGTKPGQLADVVSYPIHEVFATVEREARKLNERGPDEIGKVTRTRGVLGNAWRIAGTRIPTDLVWQLRECGCSVRTILRRYPRLTAEDVQAAIQHEAKRRRAA